jgi:PAS domain S-box-containing protein
MSDERLESLLRAPFQPEPPNWDVRVVADSARGAVAADAANRIIAVSRPLAEALGWAVEELVGRRLVTIIPPRLREAHVAGFSAHLATGEVHILGKRLQLPALRSDGTEILCRYLVEAASTLPRRPVFVAWIEPVDEDANR